KAVGRVCVCTFGSDHEGFVARAETGPDDERAVAANGRVDEIAREALRLSLSANENPDPEDDAAQAEQQSAFAMAQKAQGNVKRRAHGCCVPRGRSIIRCRTGSPGCSRS